MQNSNTDGEHVWNGGQIVAWVLLLFFLIFLCLLPFLIGGVGVWSAIRKRTRSY
ncbi:MAG TPA: hypothetical protein VK738_18065 [Terriglobales bacterium]|nr:hypothetical protein [Terriglobales bacterium]